MSARLYRLVASATLLGLVGACGGVAPGDADTRISRFFATPTAIESGDTATLQWEVHGAEQLTLLDDRGAELVNLDLAAGNAAGSVPVRPLADRTYTLRARGPRATREASASISVYSVTRPPDIVRFEASPEVLLPGDQTTLSWTVRDAAELELRAGDAVLSTWTSGNELRDGVELDAPLADTTYTLIARSPVGEATATASVSLRTVVRIVSATVTPGHITAGDRVRLAWQTTNALGLVIESATGESIMTTGDPLVVPAGSIELRPAESTDFVFTATDAYTSAQTGVALVVEPRALIDSFAADRYVVQAGETITLSWTLTNAARYELVDATQAVVASGSSASGTLDVSPAASTTYELRAYNLLDTPTLASRDLYVLPAGTPPAQLVVDATPRASHGTSGSEEYLATTVTWSATNADSLHVTPSIGHEIVAARGALLGGAGTNLGLTRTNSYKVQSIGFDFSYGGQTFDSILVSYWGYVSFDPSHAPTSPQSCAAPSSAYGGIVASYFPDSTWTNLGSVRTALQGTAPNRKRVIEFYRMGDDYEDLTHQIVLLENGNIEINYVERLNLWDYAYGMVGAYSPDGSSVIGISCNANDEFLAMLNATGSSIVLTAQDLEFAGELPTSGSRRVLVAPDARFDFVATSPGGATISQELEFIAVGAGEVAITEIMYDPGFGITDANGEWFELTSFGTRDIPLKGWSVEAWRLEGSTNVAYRQTVSTDLVLPAGGRLVFATNGDPGLNGGVTPNFVYAPTGALDMDDTSDQFAVGVYRYNGQTVGYGTYAAWNEASTTPVASGASLAFGRGCATHTSCCANTHPGGVCVSTSELAPGGNRGTPGAANDACRQGDTCDDAQLLDVTAGAVVLQTNTAGLANDVKPSCSPSATSGADAVFSVPIASAGRLRVEVGAGFATGAVVVWQDDCDDVASELACKPMTVGLVELEVPVRPGVAHVGVEVSSSVCANFSVTAELLPPHYTLGTNGGAFEDITATGVPLVVSDDGVSAAQALGFSWPFFDDALTHVKLAANGVVLARTEAGATAPPGNLPLGDAGGFAGGVAAFWDDLVPVPATSTLHVETRGSGADQRFIAQWTGWDVFNPGGVGQRDGATLTFQVVLFASGDVELRYAELTAGLSPGRAAGASATVGLESLGAAWTHQHSHDAAVLTPGLSLRYEAP